MYLKNAKDGQGTCLPLCAYSTFEYNNLKSFAIHNSGVAKLGLTGNVL